MARGKRKEKEKVGPGCGIKNSVLQVNKED
jgi:hypothetical protein